MSKLTTLVDKYAKAKQQEAKVKEQLDIVRNQLQDELAKIGVKSIKTADGKATVSMVTRVTPVVSEREFADYLADNPDLEPDLFYTRSLNKDVVVGYAEKQLKETGEVVPGISVRETEYLSIRENK